MRNAVDFVSAPNPALLEQLDLDRIPYTGNARPSAEWFADMKARGLPVHTMLQETISKRSQQGYLAGVLDCQFAERRALEVNPDCRFIDVVVSDGNGADSWDSSWYGNGWSDAAALGFFPYGAVGVTDSFLAGAARGRGAALCVQGEHTPATWPGGKRLIMQVVGPSPVPDTDLNIVHADYTGGSTGGLSVADVDMIGQWIKDAEGRIEVHVDKKIDDGLWTWVTTNADPLLRDIQKKVEALQAKVDALEAGTAGAAVPLNITLTGTAKPA